VLCAVTKLNSLDVRSLCLCKICDRPFVITAYLYVCLQLLSACDMLIVPDAHTQTEVNDIRTAAYCINTQRTSINEIHLSNSSRAPVVGRKYGP
jgi:hypothetical protein